MIPFIAIRDCKDGTFKKGDVIIVTRLSDNGGVAFGKINGVDVQAFVRNGEPFKKEAEPIGYTLEAVKFMLSL